MIGFHELDFWLGKGFGGIINILHTRVTQIPRGFSRQSSLLIQQEAGRLSELSEAVRGLPEEELEGGCTSIAPLDNWFILAFTGLDKYLGERSAGGPEPISETNLQQIEAHCRRLETLVREERKKCRNSPGISGES